jgi:hypothetical protein
MCLGVCVFGGYPPDSSCSFVIKCESFQSSPVRGELWKIGWECVVRCRPWSRGNVSIALLGRIVQPKRRVENEVREFKKELANKF